MQPKRSQSRSSTDVRRQSLVNAAVKSPENIHLSSYRRRRRAKVGGPVISLDNGIIRQRSYTNVASVVAFMIYAGVMVYACSYRITVIVTLSTDSLEVPKKGKERAKEDGNYQKFKNVEKSCNDINVLIRKVVYFECKFRSKHGVKLLTWQTCKLSHTHTHTHTHRLSKH